MQPYFDHPYLKPGSDFNCAEVCGIYSKGDKVVEMRKAQNNNRRPGGSCSPPRLQGVQPGQRVQRQPDRAHQVWQQEEE